MDGMIGGPIANAEARATAMDGRLRRVTQAAMNETQRRRIFDPGGGRTGNNEAS